MPPTPPVSCVHPEHGALPAARLVPRALPRPARPLQDGRAVPEAREGRGGRQQGAHALRLRLPGEDDDAPTNPHSSTHPSPPSHRTHTPRAARHAPRTTHLAPRTTHHAPLRHPSPPLTTPPSPPPSPPHLPSSSTLSDLRRLHLGPRVVQEAAVRRARRRDEAVRRRLLRLPLPDQGARAPPRLGAQPGLRGLRDRLRGLQADRVVRGAARARVHPGRPRAEARRADQGLRARPQGRAGDDTPPPTMPSA